MCKIDYVTFFNDLKCKNEEIEKNIVKLDSLGFNVFSIISDKFYREDFHGEIISAYLNPKSLHNGKDCYLKKFVEMGSKAIPDLKTSNYDENSKVESQYPITYNKVEGFIDILIIGKDKHCIIIENKLNNARDTWQQLPKYYRALERENYIVDAIVYLPLLPKEPETDSWNKMNDKNVVKETINHTIVIPACVDYVGETFKGGCNLVDDWIAPICVERLQEIKKIELSLDTLCFSEINAISNLEQYKRLLFKDFNTDMSKDEFKNLLDKDNNYFSAAYNLLMSGVVDRMIHEKFLEKLKIIAYDKGYCTPELVINKKDPKYITFTIKVPKYDKVFFKFDPQWNSGGYGIVVDDQVKEKVFSQGLHEDFIKKNKTKKFDATDPNFPFGVHKFKKKEIRNYLEDMHNLIEDKASVFFDNIKKDLEDPDTKTTIEEFCKFLTQNGI